VHHGELTSWPTYIVTLYYMRTEYCDLSFQGLVPLFAVNLLDDDKYSLPPPQEHFSAPTVRFVCLKNHLQSYFLLNVNCCRGICEDVSSSYICRTIFSQTIFVVVVVVVVLVAVVFVVVSRFLVKFFRSYVIAHCNVNQIIFRRTSFCRYQIDDRHLFVLFCFPH
jgi:hypothetical protein